MVASMRPGSVIVDLAAERGGNCELAKAGEVVVTANGVKIVGYSNVTRLAADRLRALCPQSLRLRRDLDRQGSKTLEINWDDELVKATCLTRDGAIVHPNFPPNRRCGAATRRPDAGGRWTTRRRGRQAEGGGGRRAQAARAAQAYADQLAAAGHAVSGGAIDPFVFRLAIFALAVFVGYYVVWSVTPALHTPLMSVTNAISSVIVVGALLSVGVGRIDSGSGFARFVGFVALILASVNIFGGFLVTERMLAMYKKKG